MLKYTLNFLPNKVFVFGCGGTGGRLIPQLSQFLKTVTWIPDMTMVLSDFDIVEEKNLTRQNFIQRDIGKYKAQVLAERYSKAFDLPMFSHILKMDGNSTEEKAAANELVKKLPGGNLQTSIIIMCVDTIQARRGIMAYLARHNISTGNCLIIDTGNEDVFGQVKIMGLASDADRNYNKKSLNSLPDNAFNTYALPGMLWDPGYFMDMVSNGSTRSCADLDQTMAVNSLVATSVFGIIQTLFYARPITFHRLNVSLDNGVIPEYMTLKWLKEINNNYDRLAIQLNKESYEVSNMKSGPERDKLNAEYGVKYSILNCGYNAISLSGIISQATKDHKEFERQQALEEARKKAAELAKKEAEDRLEEEKEQAKKDAYPQTSKKKAELDTIKDQLLKELLDAKPSRRKRPVINQDTTTLATAVDDSI